MHSRSFGSSLAAVVARFPAPRLLFASMGVFIALASASPVLADDPISKLYVDDGTWVEIANTGTRNAANRLSENTQMSSAGKTQALSVIFNGAEAAGMLVPTVLVAGDQFFAIDGTTGALVVIGYTGTSYVLPAGCSAFVKWGVPGGYN